MAGLVGGAIAGAMIVVLFFAPRPGAPRRDAVPADTPPTAESIGSGVEAATEPAPRPEVVPAETPDAPEASGAPPAAESDPAATAPAETAATKLAAPTSAPASAPEKAASPAPAPASAPKIASPTSAPASAPAKIASPPASAPATTGTSVDEESWPLLCGSVTDDTGAPIAGARVLLADLDLGARTDRRGRFCVSAPPGERTLSVIALGFTTDRRMVNVVSGGAELRVVLKALP